MVQRVRDIWDPEETTQPGTAGLSDPDPLAMLGKVAASAAKNELAIKQLSERFDKVEAALRDEGRRTRNLTVAVVVAIEVLARVSPGLLSGVVQVFGG